MGELESGSHLRESADPSEAMEVVVMVKHGDEIRVFDGLSDRIQSCWASEGTYWADNDPYWHITDARNMTIHFPNGFSERTE